MENLTEKNSILEVENLNLAYDDYQVLENVSFSVKRGKCTVLMGGSGCGKSTLLKSMVGLLAPVSGKILVDSLDLWSVDQEQKTSILKKYGVLFQGGALWGAMNLVENVSLPLETYTDLGENEINDLARYKLNLVGLSGYGDFYPAQLSGGMKKRVGIARAIAMNIKYLFCDEPNSGLDPITSRVIDDLLLDITAEYGITTMIISHDMKTAFDIGDKILFLYEGKIRWQGSKNEIHSAGKEIKELGAFIASSQI